MATRNVVKALEDWNANILPDDRHDKYCRMAISPFAFYRGSNHLFWKHFSKDPRLERFGNQKTRTWLQGDMHAENMGVFDNDREEVVYGINDFDDSVIADYQFDVWRMAASLVLVGRQNGLTEQEQENVTDVFGDTYLETLISYAGNQKALHTYFTKDNTCKTLSKFLKQVEKKRTRKLMLKKWTSTGKGRRFFSLSERMDPFSVNADPPIRVTEKLAPVSASERTAILNAIPGFRKTLAIHCKHKKSNTEVKDVAQRLLAGTGSLGTPRYYVLLRGKKKNNDDRILDVKLQTRPSAYFFFTADRKKEFDKCFQNAGEIHASAYRSLTTVRDKKGNAIHADDFVGWLDFFDKAYSARERSPRKRTFDTSTLNTEKGLTEMAEQWAKVLATAHQRAHSNFVDRVIKLYPLADEVAELSKGKKKKFRKLVSEVASSYASQVVQDWTAFRDTLAPTDCPPPD